MMALACGSIPYIVDNNRHSTDQRSVEAKQRRSDNDEVNETAGGFLAWK